MGGVGLFLTARYRPGLCGSGISSRRRFGHELFFSKWPLVFFFRNGPPKKSTKRLPEVRWGGLGVAQRRQGRSGGACGGRDGSGLVLMPPRHATGGHMCHGPGRPSGVNAAPHRPPEPRMPAQGPTNEPPSGPHIHCDRPTRSLAPLAPHPLLAAPAAPKSRSTRPWRDRESA